MLQEALRKLQEEIASANGDGYVEAVGAMLINHIRKHPHHAPLVTIEGKSISKSIDAMAAEAKKRAKNNRAVLSDAEGFAVVLQYYGVPAAQPATPVVIAPAARLDVTLDDLF